MTIPTKTRTPIKLPCGHTDIQHGRQGCAFVRRVAADIDEVERREQRWSRLAERIGNWFQWRPRHRVAVEDD